MLVGAFQVHVGREHQALVGAVAQHAGVRDAGLPPHVQDVLLGHELGAAAHLAVRAVRADTSLGFLVNQASAPFLSNSSMTRVEASASLATVSPHLAHLNTGMGTPQLRWREMHQSGRSATMEPMRFDGPARVRTSRRARWRRARRSRRPFLSMETNHWSVARKMTGSWQRQQCG